MCDRADRMHTKCPVEGARKWATTVGMSLRKREGPRGIPNEP